MEPFVAPFQGQALTQRAKTYVSGLLSDVERKNVESITYQFGQNRLGLQGFIGWADWDDEPLRQELLGQVGKPLGQGDGVLVFDPSAFPKSGRESVKQWAESLGDEAWRRVDVRDGSKGPLVVDVVKRRMVSRTHRRQQGGKELLVVIRYRDWDQEQVVQVDYDLSNAAPGTPLPDLARVAKAAHRIEECLQRRKSEAGLADYEVRHWAGWQHHQTLSFLATWFLERETHRGKTMDACDHLTTDSPGHCDDLARGVSVRHDVAYAGPTPEALATSRVGSLLSLETTSPIGSIELT